MSKRNGRRQTAPQKRGKSLFAQPPENLYGRTSIYLCGRELEVENFRELLDYQQDRVRLRLSCGILTVLGDCLELAALEKHRIRLCGTVLKTEFFYETQTLSESSQSGGAEK